MNILFLQAKKFILYDGVKISQSFIPRLFEKLP